MHVRLHVVFRHFAMMLLLLGSDMGIDEHLMVKYTLVSKSLLFDRFGLLTGQIPFN